MDTYNLKKTHTDELIRKRDELAKAIDRNELNTDDKVHLFNTAIDSTALGAVGFGAPLLGLIASKEKMSFADVLKDGKSVALAGAIGATMGLVGVAAHAMKAREQRQANNMAQHGFVDRLIKERSDSEKAPEVPQK